MNQEKDFVELLDKTSCLIDDATHLQKEVGLGTFLTYWDKYKNLTFPGYTQECLNSSSFRNYVWLMMGMVKLIDKNVEEDKTSINNIVNFCDYKKINGL